MYSGTPAPVSIKIGARRPTRYVLVPGPVIMPGLRPSTRPTRSLGVAVRGKSGSIQLTASLDGRSSGDPQEAALDVLVRVEVRRRAMVHDLSLAHHVDAVGDAQRERHVLLDEQDAQALALETDEHAPDLADDNRGQALGGLGEQKEARVGHERAADGEHLLFASRQRAGPLRRALAETREQRVDVVA